jgi:hypothetical protein
MSPSSWRSDADPFAFLVARGAVAEVTSAGSWLQAQLDVEAALADLAAIFPILEQEDAALDFGEPATYAGAEYQSYRQEHTDIFQPIGTLYRLIRRISAAVIHNVGALG